MSNSEVNMYEEEDIMVLLDEKESGSEYSKLGQFVIQSCPGSRSTTPLLRSGSVISRSRSAKSRPSGRAEDDIKVIKGISDK